MKHSENVKRDPHSNKKFFWGLNFIFLLGLVLRIALVSFNVQSYDYLDDNHRNRLAQADAGSFYLYGRQVIRSWKGVPEKNADGQPYYFGSYLFPRLIALYGFITDTVQPERHEIPVSIPPGELAMFLLAQSLFYMLALIYFVRGLGSIIGSGAAIGTAFVLASEPTLLQYASLLYTECIFFGLIFLVFGYGLRLAAKGQRLQLRGSLILGLILGVCYLQRPSALLWPLIFILSFCLFDCLPMAVAFYRRRFLDKEESVKNPLHPFLFALIYRPLAIASGYAVILLFLGIMNYQSRGFFQVLPTQSQVLLYNDFLGRTGYLDISDCEQKADSFVQSFHRNKHPAEKIYRKFQYCHRQALSNVLSSGAVFWRFLADFRLRLISVLKSNELFFGHKQLSREYKPSSLTPLQSFEYDREDYFFAQMNRSYLLFVYFLFFFGFLLLLMKRHLFLILVCSGSILMFSGIAAIGLHDRYFAPNLIFMSPFIGYLLAYTGETLRIFLNWFSRIDTLDEAV